jgi:hypothetical protein
MDILMAMGVPTAITGLCIWFFKRHIDKKDRERDRQEAARLAAAEEREKNYERMMLMIMQNSRATYVLSHATAMAVQRIPDAHCNGDMTSALEEADRIQKEEQEFLIDQGVRHIFG